MTPGKPRRTLGGKLRLVAAALAVLLLLPLLFAGWLLTSEAGARFALDLARRASGITLVAEGMSGRLIGPLSFDALRVETPDLRVEAGPLELRWSPRRLTERRLRIDGLSVDTLRIATRPSDEEPSGPLQMPQIALPIFIDGELAVDRVLLMPWDDETAAPLAFSDIRATLSGEGAVQRIDALRLTSPWGEATLRGSIDTGVFPHAIVADGTVHAVLDERTYILAYGAQGDLSQLAVQVQGAGDKLSGQTQARLAPFEPFPLLDARLAVQGFDPAAFVAGAPTAELNLDATLANAGDGMLEGDVAVHNARPLRMDEGGLPFETLATHVRASLAEVVLQGLELALSGGGRLSGDAALQLPDESTALSATATLAASGVDPSRLHAAAPDGNVQLDLDAGFAGPDQLQLAFTLGDGQLLGMALGGEGQLRVEGLRVPEADLRLALGPGSLSARGAWGEPGDALDVQLRAPRLDQLGMGLAGSVEVDAVLGGTLEAPAGRVRAQGSALQLPNGTDIGRVALSGVVEGGLDGPVDVELDVSDVGGGEDARWLERLQATIRGTRLEHVFELDALIPQGEHLRLALRGGQPQDDLLAWNGVLQRLQLEGRLPLRLEAPAALEVSPQRAALATARLRAGEAGRITLAEILWTPDAIRLVGDLTGLVVIEPERRRGRGPGPLTLGAEWDVELGAQADGNLRVFRESGDLAIPGALSTFVGLEQLEAVVVASGQRLAVSLDARGKEVGTLSGTATARLVRDEGGAWSLAQDADLLGSAKFDMPSIAWLSRLLQVETVLDGALQAEFSVTGTPADPLASGRITGQELSMMLVEHGVQLSGGELLAEFDRDRLHLRRLDFVSPNRVRPPDRRIPIDALTSEPGRLTSSGEIALETGEGRFSFEADRLPILQRDDRWLIMSGSGSATSTWTSLDIQADFRADAGYIEFADSPPPSLSDDVVIVGTEEPPAGGMQLSADVSVTLGDALYLTALGLDTRLAGDLQLRLRPGDALAANGTISTVGGVYRGYGQSMAIERGVINFQGALDNPGLNVVALRKGLAVEAGVAVTGSVRRPQVGLVSEPDVPDSEKLSWIVLGRAPSAGGGADLGLLLPAAQALLGGPGGGITDQLSRSLGFDEFGIGQSTAGVGRVQTSRVVGSGTTVTGEGELSGQVLTLGKRLSDDLSVSFEQSLSGAESLVLLTYQLTRRVSVIARGGSDNAADIYYTITFR